MQTFLTFWISNIYQTGYQKKDPFTVYLEMGAPSALTISQEAILKKVSNDKPEKETIIEIKTGKLSEQFSIRGNDVFMINISKL